MPNDEGMTEIWEAEGRLVLEPMGGTINALGTTRSTSLATISSVSET